MLKYTPVPIDTPVPTETPVPDTGGGSLRVGTVVTAAIDDPYDRDDRAFFGMSGYKATVLMERIEESDLIPILDLFIRKDSSDNYEGWGSTGDDVSAKI